MAQLDFRSPGISTREIDLTGPTAIQPTGIPAGVISTTQLGPAFVPVTVPTIQDWRTVFGLPVTNLKFGALAATEWLRTQQALTHLRVLGVGDGTQRTTSGINRGKVNSAGFVVGDQQPQTLLSGGLGNNILANASSSGPTAVGPAGRTYILGCFMSQSTNSTIFSDAGFTGTNKSTPVVRGVLFAASGVLLQLSAANVDSSAPNPTFAADATTTNVHGAPTGSVKLTGGLQEFVLLLNGKTADVQNPNVLTCSFDPNAPNYFGTVLNRDPLKVEDAGLLLYAHWDVYPAVAVPTGSGVILQTPISGAGLTGYENIAFITPGASARNSGSIYSPNFENFEDRYRTAATPWIISQLFGGQPENLFRVWALSDGDAANTKVKISIENINPSTSTQVQYGTFDLIVRDFNDTDGNKVILEQWRGLSLDATSDKFIGKIIGDLVTSFNWDATSDSQKLITNGDYPIKSHYIRVELADGVKNSTTPQTALPFGFRGPRHLVTSGSAPLPSFSDSFYFVSPNVLNNVVELPVPYRLNLAKGTSPNLTSDKTLYWGVQFEQVTSALEPNASTAPNKSMYAQTKYFPNFHTDFMNVVYDSVGVADSAQNGILDADRFNNNLFTLEKVRVVYNTTSNVPDVNQLSGWAYVRTGSIATDITNARRGLQVTDLTDPGVRSVAKFTVHMAGGFDGTRIFNKDMAYLTNKAIVEEINNASRGYANGPTVLAYQHAIDIMKNNLEVDIQLLTIPGIRHRVITDYALAAVRNDRFDCFYIFDIEERDGSNNPVVATTQTVSVRNTTSNFRGRGLDNSFGGAYFPDVIIQDEFNRTVERVPPSVAVLGAFGMNDAVGHPWFAPAGFNRASLNSVRNVSIPLGRDNMGDLYSERINPIVSFAGQGPVVWGQKTTRAATGSALERINVRRMLLAARRQVKKVANRIMFEPNRTETLDKFQKLVDPIMKQIQDQGGVSAYSVQINTSTTTQADIENKTIRGKIFVVPTRTLEMLSLDFVITNRGTFLNG